MNRRVLNIDALWRNVLAQNREEESDAYGNPCFDGAIVGAREVGTRSLTAESTSSGIFGPVRRAQLALYGKSKAWEAAVKLGTRRERDKRGTAASLS